MNNQIRPKCSVVKEIFYCTKILHKPPGKSDLTLSITSDFNVFPIGDTGGTCLAVYFMTLNLRRVSWVQ